MAHVVSAQNMGTVSVFNAQPFKVPAGGELSPQRIWTSASHNMREYTIFSMGYFSDEGK